MQSSVEKAIKWNEPHFLYEDIGHLPTFEIILNYFLQEI